MPLFRLEKDNAAFNVDAPDADAALAAFEIYYTPQVAFETRIPPDQEPAFQAWKAANAPKDSGADYDLHGAFLAGVKPDPETGHWPDTFKKPNHPTFSDQSKYAAYGKPGSWDGDTYVPAGGAAPAPKDMLAQPAPKDLLAEPEEPRNILSEIAVQAFAGLVVDVPDMIGKAADWVNPGSGKGLRDWAKSEEIEHPWLAPQLEGRTGVGRVFSQGARMLAPSMASVAVATAAAFGAVELGAGVGLSALIGIGTRELTTIGLFGGSQAEDTYEKLRADGVSEEDAKKAGWLSGAIEAGGESIGGMATRGLLKGVVSPFVKNTAAAILGRATSTAVLRPAAKALVVGAGEEALTEFGQGAGETAVENAYGAKNPQSPWVVGLEGGEAALAMSVLLAPFGIHANYKRAQENAPLANADAPENERYRAAVRVHADLTAFDEKNDTDLQTKLEDISSDNSKSDGQKNAERQEARSNARKDAGNNWASNVWARNAGLAIQQKLAVDLSPEQLTTPAEPNAPEPDQPLDKAALFSESRARTAAIEAKLAAAAKPTPAEREVAPSAAETEATLAKKKADALNGSQGPAPIVKRITNINETIEDFAAAATLAAGTVSNPVTVPDRIAEGYKEVPSGSEYRTRLTKTNDDNTVNTIEVGSNGAVESDLTVLGNFTVNDAPVSVRFDNINSRLQAIEEDGNVTDLSDDANRKYTSGSPLLDILQAEDPGATIAPVALGETVAPAETPAGSPQPREFVFAPERAADTPAAFAPPKEFELAGDTELAARVLDTAETKVAEIPAEFQPAFMSAVNEFLGLAPFTTAREMDKESPEWNAAYVAGWTHAGEQRAATEDAAPVAQTAAPQPINLDAQIENLKEKASQADPGSIASRILSRTVEHLTAPTKASRVNLKSVLLNPEAKAGADAQVVEAVDAAKAALASEGEATFTASKPDINKKRMTKLLGPQLYGNMSDIGIVTVKELFQNSFDAVKGALERGSISLGHINITTDRTARTITIVDDGGGMALDTINKAFLTMAGTEKDTARASGGLGIAKMLFLLGNKALRLETVRAGKIHRMDTSGEQIAEALDDSTRAPQIETRSTTAAPGTTVVVTLPETYVDTDTEEVKNIYFPANYELRDLIDASPLFANIDVVFNGEIRPVGARYELNGATLLTAVKFAWGTARLLVRPNKYSSRGGNFNVLSEGLNQFSLGISKEPGRPYSDPVPYDFILNLEPDVKADSPRYPIALNRKDFSPSGKSDMAALISYVNVLYANKSEQDSAKSFGQLTLISQSPQGSVLKRIDLNIPDAAVGSVLSIDPSDVVTVTDGRVYVNNKLTPPLTKENIKAMRRDPAQFRVDQSQIDPRDILVHDNVLTDGKPLLEEARLALGANAVNGFLRDFGVVLQELRAAVARVGGASYASVTQVPTGLSFDLEYYGVNTVIPFKAIMLNPLVVRDKETGGPMRPDTVSRADRAGTFVGTMVHELTHHAERNHSETGFIPELARLSVQLAVSGDMATAVQNVDQLLQRYDAVAEYFMERNANGNLTARGIRLDGDAELTKFQRLPERAARPGGAGRDGADSVREGVGRGNTTSTRSQERGGSAAEGGDGAAVALPRRVLKGRVPELQDAADKVYAGLMSREEYQRLVDIYKPVRPFTSVPAMPTQLDLERGLRKDQIARIGQETNIPEGEAVGLRLDIEAYTDNNVWAPTIHKGHAEGSKPIAHAPFARITDVDFGVSSDKALRVARGGAKSPFAKMDGFWTKTSAEDIQAMAEKFLNDPAWTQVGMDPERHEGFYDRRTQRQLAHADEVIQIGPLVLARNVTFRDISDVRYSVKSDKMGATGTAKAWVEFAEVKKLIDFGVVKTLAQAKAAAEADYTKTFDALPAFDAKAYLEGVIAVEGPLLPQNIQDAIQAYKNGDEGGAVGTLLADVKRAREGNIARWKNYFDNVNTEQGSDPFWKSYVAHGVVNTFDATKPNTGETFNAAALATVYGKFLEGTAPNFTKAYRAAKMAATADLVELGDAQNGWRKVPQTAKSDPNFAERVAEVQAISSESWCTKTYNAAPYIAQGDFWVYVDNGKPELAIRFEGSDVAEIQGRANNGSIPSQYAGEVQALVDSGKIQNLAPRTKKALQDATDRSLALKRLASEATFVEEIDSGGASIRVYEKANGDLVLLTEGPWSYLPAQYANRVVEVIGNLYMSYGVQANNLTTVSGDLQVDVGVQVNNLTTVGGRVVLHRFVQANSLTTVGGGLYMHENAEANNLTTVGGDLTLLVGAQANSVTTVGGDLELHRGAQANSVTTVGGNLALLEGAQANSVTTVGGNLLLSEGAQANNVTTVGGDLLLYKDAQANSLTTVGGDLTVDKDTQANSVTTVGGALILYDESAQALSLQAVGGKVFGNTPKNTPNLKHIGDKDAVERIKAQTEKFLIGTAPGGSITTLEVEAAVISALDKLQIGTEIYGTVEEARAETGVDIPVGAKGMYAQGKIHLFAENITNAVDAQITVWHEILHAGLDRLYKSGSKKFNAALVTIAARNPRVREEAAKWTKSFGADLEADAIRLGRTPERAAQYVRMRAIDEALAIMSSENVTIRGLDKFIAVVQNIIRQIGLTKLADAMEGKTNAEALALISKARGALLADGSYVVTDSAPAFLRGRDLEALTVNAILRESYPAVKARSRTVPAIATELMFRGRAALKKLGVTTGVIQGPNPKTDDILSSAIASEVKAALGRTGKNASGWYSTRVKEAMKTALKLHPELADKNQKMAFTLALAVTSQGETVASNVRLAEQVYASFKKTGVFPTNVLAKKQKSINGNFRLLNKLIANLGLDGTNEFLFSEFTVKQLNDAGYKVGGENKQTKVYGSAILGPKIGQGFYQNLNNNFTPVTMDLWFMRGWGRLTGNLVGGTQASRTKQRVRFEAALKTTERPVPETLPALIKLARGVVKQHESDYRENRDKYDSGERVKSELTYSAERIIFGLAGLKETPSSGAQREWIRSVVAQARQKLKADGVTITPADLQAVWWYPEKELYSKLGGRDSEGINVDYAIELKKLYDRRRAEGQLGSVADGPRPGSTGDVGRPGRRGGEERESSDGKTRARKKVVESIPYNAVQTTVRLNKLEDETDPVALKNGVVALARDLRVQAANRPVRERSRGYDWIQERLLRAARLGQMNREQVRLGMWLLNNNPNLANDLGISLRAARSNDASGNYNPMSRIMTLFKGRGQDTLIAHEILHHAERMMPEDIQAGIRAEWLSQITGMLDAAIRTKDTEMVEHIRDALAAAAGDTAAYNRVADGIRNGTLSQDFYQYINPSEFWAVNAADIVAARASESWVQRAVQWLREFKAKIQELFNFPSNAAVIRGLDNVLNAANEGERQSPNMLSEGNTFNAVQGQPGPSLPVPSTRVEKEKDRLTYNLVDRFVDLKNLMKSIRARVAKLPETLDAYSMVERLTSKVAKRVEDFTLRELGPLLEDMKMRGVSVDELGNYLWMRAAPDANAIIAAQPDTKFPNLDGAGVSTTDAQAYLAALTPKQRTAFEALAKRVDAITAKTRREWVRYGMATLDDVLKMEREQPYYVPFNREGKNIGAGSGQGVSVRGPNTFHRKGSKLPVVDVLANIVHQRDRAIMRGEKNIIARAIYALAKTFPSDMWSLAAPGITSAIDVETGEPVNVLDMSYQKDDNVLMSIRLDKNGKMVAQGVAFNESDPQAMRMVAALKNLDLPSLDGLVGAAAQITRYFAALNTQYNPVFGLINLTRDVPTALLNLSTTPIAGKQFTVLKHVFPALAAIYKGARTQRAKGASAATPYDLYFERLRNAGGTSGWRQSFENSADRGKALQAELDSMSNGTAKKILPALGGWLSDYNTAMENSTRLAAFITAVESGMSDAQAASLAKNLTVNFDRKGQKSSQIGALYAFFNPSVQGTVRTLETLAGPAGKKIIAGGLLLGAIQAVFLAMAGFDDDDPPEFVRQRNFIMPIGSGKYVSFPMPLSFNLLPNIGRLAMQTALHPQNIGKNVFSVFDAALSTFNPFGSGVTLQTITPTALDPLAAIASNTDWTGKPIEREDFSALDLTPGFTRAKDNATFVGKIVARAINTLTGGDKYTPGGWSPTPDMLDYVAGQLTGGPGRELIHLESSVEGWLKGEEVPTYKIPVVGRFYGNVGSAASDKARYFENVKTLNELENNVKGMLKDRVSSAAFKKDNPETRLIPAVNVIKRQIADFRKLKEKPGNDTVKTDALILRQMQRLNALVAPYEAPTAQQKFLRDLAP